MKALTRWIADGTPWVWLNAAAVAASILLVTGLLLLIGIRGVGHFWPLAVHQIVYQEADGTEVVVTGQIRERETVTATRLRESGLEVAEGTELVHRDLLKTGNRDVTGQDFRWILEPSIQSMSRPRSMVVLEREEWGVFIGMLIGVREAGQLLESPDTWGDFQSRLERANELRDEIRELEKNRIGSVNYRLERLRLKQRGLELKGKLDAENLADIESDRALLQEEYRGLEQELVDLYSKLQLGAVVVTTGDGKELELPMSTIVDAHRPNQMGLAGKIGHFFHNCWKFVTEDPREANTEGGIFPAIFGTVLMVLLMSVFVTPLGVVAAVYLKEYARQGMFTRFIRVAVNNLAGVPSIVYGVFG
ncbi:MAG: phosphate ABC transporter, permease protein PstA, partial [Gammaproteobacteria bacterium]|nr:phosphate ABC transporter, permease protein PstA [Gammaproteobacteria bacterium]